jgi:hypothetical protein
MSSGLKPGEMFVVAARPSMGKTSLMMNIVEHVCIDLGKPSMVFSCEMSSFQLVQRLLFSRAKFARSQLSRGYAPAGGEAGIFPASFRNHARQRSGTLPSSHASGCSARQRVKVSFAFAGSPWWK